jgi:hypothetical protein
VNTSLSSCGFSIRLGPHLESYQIKDVILNILIPQRDNVSNSALWLIPTYVSRFPKVALVLTSIVYFLALHPLVTSRLHQEIMDYLGPSRRPNSDDLREMRYLRAVINGMTIVVIIYYLVLTLVSAPESLRLKPPVYVLHTVIS